MSRLLMLSLISVTCLFSFTQEAAPSRSAEETQLLKMQADLIAAENNNNAGLFDKLVAEDWVNTNSTGQTLLAKKGVLAELRKAKPYKVSVKDTATHVFGNTGVLTFTKEYTNIQGDIQLAHVVEVFTRDSDGWKLRFSEVH